ncbi:MAG: VapC toxin family PIN domain ribonuclease [Actinomycetota bacterium]|nr:VapC toxin family PIN domain ribonuclease [Actinomycetota bacterium]
MELGIHLATTDAVRGRRLRTLQAARSTYVALPVDDAVASAFAELVATAHRTGRRPKVLDTWIAAIARAHAVAVYTQARDFEELDIEVVRVWPEGPRKEPGRRTASRPPPSPASGVPR